MPALRCTGQGTPHYACNWDANCAAGSPNGSAGGNHVAIGDYGKLGGEMGGYAWVAGGTGTTFSAPQPCNESGCFRNTQGRLCSKGTIRSHSTSASPTSSSADPTPSIGSAYLYLGGPTFPASPARTRTDGISFGPSGPALFGTATFFGEP